MKCPKGKCLATAYRTRITELEEIAAEYDGYRKETKERIAELEAAIRKIHEHKHHAGDAPALISAIDEAWEVVDYNPVPEGD